MASQLLFGSCLSREEAALDCEEQTLPRGRKGAAEIVTVESWLYHRQFASSEEHLMTGGFRILGSVCHSAFPDGIGYRGRERAHIPVHLFHSKGMLSRWSQGSHKSNRTQWLCKLNAETPLPEIINSSFSLSFRVVKNNVGIRNHHSQEGGDMSLSVSYIIEFGF